MLRASAPLTKGQLDEQKQTRTSWIPTIDVRKFTLEERDKITEVVRLLNRERKEANKS